MFQHNILLQTCAVLGLITMAAVAGITVINWTEFKSEVPNWPPVTVIYVMVMLGLLRGAF